MNLQTLKPGEVDPDTKRIAITLRDFANSPLNGDFYAYLWSLDSWKMGLDPWSVIDGIDAHTKGEVWDVWFTTGYCKTFGDGDLIIFVSAKDMAEAQKDATL